MSTNQRINSDFIYIINAVHSLAMGVGETMLYCPNDGVRSDIVDVGGILRTLIGVRGVGTATTCFD